MGKPAILTTACVSGCLLLCGWTRPQSPSSAAPSGELSHQLDYIVVHVNKEPRIVRSGEELAVVRGDVLRIEDAKLKDGARSVKRVNLVGYQATDARGKKRSNEDRGAPINTLDSAFRKKFSENGDGRVYAVTAETGHILHGQIFIKLVDPVLRYAELSVNGKKMSMRDGELLRIKKNDLVKVDKVVTNLETDDDVFVQMTSGVRQDEVNVEFMRGDFVFARIPVDVRE